MSKQKLLFNFSWDGKNYMFWLWIASWGTQEPKHCLKCFEYGILALSLEHILPEKWKCWHFFQLKKKKKFSIHDELEFGKIGRVLWSHISLTYSHCILPLIYSHMQIFYNYGRSTMQVKIIPYGYQYFIRLL